MNQETPPRLRGTPLLLARAAALTVSIGVLLLLMVHAGPAGCRQAEPEVQAEARSAAPGPMPTAPAAPTTPTPASPAAQGGKPQFLVEPKEPDLGLPAPLRPQAVAPQARAGASATAAPRKPHFFSGSKAMAGSLVDDDPPAAPVAPAAPNGPAPPPVGSP